MTRRCLRCFENFSDLNRRHHCRYCGWLVCGACRSDDPLRVHRWVSSTAGHALSWVDDGGQTHRGAPPPNAAFGCTEKRVCRTCAAHAPREIAAEMRAANARRLLDELIEAAVATAWQGQQEQEQGQEPEQKQKQEQELELEEPEPEQNKQEPGIDRSLHATTQPELEPEPRPDLAWGWAWRGWGWGPAAEPAAAHPRDIELVEMHDPAAQPQPESQDLVAEAHRNRTARTERFEEVDADARHSSGSNQSPRSSVGG